jgi:hypothetical protein
MEDQAEMDNDEEFWATSTAATLIATGNEEKRRLGIWPNCLGCNLTKLSPFDQMFRVSGLGPGLPDDVGSMFVPIFFTVEVVFPGWCHSSARLLLLRQAPGWAIYTESSADGFRWIVCMEGHDHQYWVILDFIDMFTSFLYLYNPLQHRCKMLQSNICYYLHSPLTSWMLHGRRFGISRLRMHISIKMQ